MTTNTLAAIRERAAAYRKAWFDFAGLNHFDPRFEQARHVLDVERVSAPADRAALLAIVDELTARAEAAEAALREIAADDGVDDDGVFDEWSQAFAFDRVQKIAADALAAHDANGESAGNGGA